MRWTECLFTVGGRDAPPGLNAGTGNRSRTGEVDAGCTMSGGSPYAVVPRRWGWINASMINVATLIAFVV